MECEYCTKTFVNKYVLKHHQKSARYCMKLRQDVSSYKCTDCDTIFTTNATLRRHHNKCVSYNVRIAIEQLKEEHEDEILELTNKIYELEHDLEAKEKELEAKEKSIVRLQDNLTDVAIKAATKPTHTTTNSTQVNNYIQKLEVVTDKYIQDQVPNLTIEHIKRGARGYAEYALNHPLNNRLLCVDYSRRKIKYKDSDGSVVIDPEMSKLAPKFFQSINEKNKELARKYVNELSENMDNDVKLSIMTDMADNMVSVDKGSRGEKTELYHDFVKKLCSETLN